MNFSNIYISILILIFVFGIVCIVYEVGRLTVTCEKKKLYISIYQEHLKMNRKILHWFLIYLR